MSDLGYTFTTPPYLEVVDGIEHMKFNIDGIEQDYDFTMSSIDGNITMYDNTISNASAAKEEQIYFKEIMTALLNP